MVNTKQDKTRRLNRKKKKKTKGQKHVKIERDLYSRMLVDIEFILGYGEQSNAHFHFL